MKPTSCRSTYGGHAGCRSTTAVAGYLLETAATPTAQSPQVEAGRYAERDLVQRSDYRSIDVDWAIRCYTADASG